jgi:hypothetical protein
VQPVGGSDVADMRAAAAAGVAAAGAAGPSAAYVKDVIKVRFTAAIMPCSCCVCTHHLHACSAVSSYKNRAWLEAPAACAMLQQHCMLCNYNTPF